MTRNPRLDLPLVVAFCLATVASFFAMGWTAASYLFDRFKETP